MTRYSDYVSRKSCRELVQHSSVHMVLPQSAAAMQIVLELDGYCTANTAASPQHIGIAHIIAVYRCGT